MAVYGYIRVSTEGKGQTTDNQRKLIVDGGIAVTEFFSEDGVSGSVKAFERPAFSTMLARCVEGDTIVITMIDRLGRSASDVLNVVEDLKARGIKLKVMQFDGMDITSAMGKMILTCMSAMAELERNILIERTNAGLERTKAQGTKLGRPLTIEPSILRTLVDHVRAGSTLSWLSDRYNLPRNTIHRNVKEWGNKLDEYEAEWESRKQQYANRGI
jgi:putative DNA-invertase from lambdoid prophage Rac